MKGAPRKRPRALGISPKLLYQWQEEAFTPVAAALGVELDPATAANRRQAQELEMLKKAIASYKRRLSRTLD